MADGGNVIFKFTADDKQLTKTLKGLGNTFKNALKGLAAGTAAVAAGFAGIVTASVNARGEFQQLEGGIQSIFGGIEKGQEQIDKVMQLSNEAWKNLTMSSNDYMTNFMSTYPLMKNDIADVNEAIDKTNRIMTLNSDLANTFGYSMETASNAVNWALKGTFSYLDNLNIGIKGTKEGFLEAAKKAGYAVKKVSDISKLSSSDILDILEKAASEYGVLNKTADEAATTMTGSINMVKAAWENFLTGTGDLGQVAESGRTAFENIKAIIEEALPEITEQIKLFLPELLSLAGEILGTIGQVLIDNLPIILDSVGTILDSIGQAINDNQAQISDITFKLMGIMAKAIISAIPHVLEAIGDMIGNMFLAIVNFNDKIWQAGADYVKNMVEGIKKNIQIVRAVWELIKKVIGEAVQKLIGDSGNWGKDLIEGFKKGIVRAMSGLLSAVGNVANAIRSLLHFSRPDTGPLRDYETWMPDMIKGMAKSLDNAAPYLLDKVNNLASAMSLSPTINENVNNASPKVNVIVNNSYEADPLGQMVNKIKTFSNGAKNDFNYGYGG